MSSHWSLYWSRTGKIIRDGIQNVVLMKGADAPNRAPRTLFTFNSQEDINLFATGCDGDIGGKSTVYLDLDENPEHNAGIGKQATSVFWGEMRLGVKPAYEGKIRGGYAGFRNKTRPTLFGNMLEDVSTHEYLALRLRLAGDPSTRNSYFVNIQTDGPISTDLWQHRLYFRKQDNSWENVFVPFDSFVRTNSGELSTEQIGMYREKIRSIGISLLGGNSRVEGRYELGIDSISVVNEEDVVRAPVEKNNDQEPSLDSWKILEKL
ncbi:complex I intermediate-associated protein CIA30 [Crucibulum laeve]|uniref:Complex I intermediate-associated protein CIA30 n=1 Tax=Crucibulum laeve TaxID=68775 RepID=A0A5C3M4A1_9AGAR|nr:complex I intermediate-associated protein CIA30 [Crucibulum laeve]